MFEGARLVVGDGTVVEDAAFVVVGDRITEVGRVAEVRGPPGSTTVDLGGHTVIPALIDAHAHLGYEGYTGWGADHYGRANLIDHLDRYAYYGIGAVLSAGSDPDDLALELQAAQRAGEVGGARFLFAAGMAPPDQGPNNQFLDHVLALEERTGMEVVRGAASPPDARSAVQEVAAKGIPFIKIWVDNRGGSQEKLRPDVYRAIIDEARSRGMEVLVHQQSAEDMPDLLEAGVAGFLHGRLGPALDADLAARLREAGAFLVPNLGLAELRRERVADDPFLQETLPPEVRQRLGHAFDQRPGVPPSPERERELSEAFSRLVDAGVDVVLGTDSGAIPDHFFGYSGHRELEIFVRLGMTPAQALEAATSRAAAALGLDDLGTIAPGKSAAFVVLEENPLEDIRNTRTISRVYLRGQSVQRDELRRRWTRRN